MTAEEIKTNEQTQDNKISESFMKAEFFVDKNKKFLLYGLAGIAGLFVLYFGYKKLIVEPKEKEAQRQMFSAQYYFENNDYAKAINGDGQHAGLIAIADDYSGTNAGNLANFYLGISFLKTGKFQEAIDALENYSAKDQITGILATGAIGDAYLELNNYEQAIAMYEKAANGNHKATTPMYLKKSGLAYELKGDKEKAFEVYTTIKNEYPQSSEAFDVDVNLGKLQEELKK